MPRSRPTCAECPSWKRKEGQVTIRCAIDGTPTLADHHCHVRFRGPRGAAVQETLFTGDAETLRRAEELLAGLMGAEPRR
ncbi:hypothetical protein [Arenibaculum pallidiluteum]|uniref:hypothetical protein n=1 Tax=Arenibaculum pallidiluteum TaxID=2812559 RepID=UPI001A959D7A|nr:hypothetical protein [Arenibaculum pallidiluteum]